MEKINIFMHAFCSATVSDGTYFLDMLMYTHSDASILPFYFGTTLGYHRIWI